jgi:hydroxymethylbilane synthase
MTRNAITIGSRGSELALWQAHWVRNRLRERFPGLAVELEIIKTTGDKVLDSPLSKIGDKGLFTREIENALLKKQIDLAVHSLKDLPTELPAGLMLGAICEREDVRDVFIPHPSNKIKTLLDQPAGSRIATGSLRRRCQLLHLRPDFAIIEIRGNLNTRMKKLEESDWAGMLLARAGVVRLGWESQIGETLDASTMLPAVGQGALGIEIREGDKAVADIIRALHHPTTAAAALAERSLLRRLEGGCQVPIGTFASRDKEAPNQIVLNAVVGSVDGRTLVRGTIRGSETEAEEMGRKLAEQLLSGGADEILRAIRSAPEGIPQRA